MPGIDWSECSVTVSSVTGSGVARPWPSWWEQSPDRGWWRLVSLAFPAYSPLLVRLAMAMAMVVCLCASTALLLCY